MGRRSRNVAGCMLYIRKRPALCDLGNPLQPTSSVQLFRFAVGMCVVGAASVCSGTTLNVAKSDSLHVRPKGFLHHPDLRVSSFPRR